MFSIKERLVVVSVRLQGISYEQARENFVPKFKKLGPSKQPIRNFVNKFQRIGNVADESRSQGHQRHKTNENTKSRSPTATT
ncbi:hypothetical protein NPIL_452941 [Nephila pilipes]|uniref:DUF4817 domain-containing protein n=1 Tax=Nephila pilipes TaxID=299642 RepID=A0A8X6UUN3_NEPPI|nr:hypothetical protein NPIL_452941 [Nephila pilipes]